MRRYTIKELLTEDASSGYYWQKLGLDWQWAIVELRRVDNILHIARSGSSFPTPAAHIADRYPNAIYEGPIQPPKEAHDKEIHR